MGPRGRREVILTIQPLFSSPQTDNCLQNSTDSLMSEAIEAYKPRQQCLFLAVSAGVCTACLGITLFTLGGWRQLAPMGLRTGRGYSHFFFIYLEDLLAGYFWLDLVQTLRSEKTCCHVDPFLCSLLMWCHQGEETFSVLLQRFCFHSDAPKLEGSRRHNKTVWTMGQG